MAQKTLGVMLDCSRNAVMKPEKVKEFAKLIADMGYNMLQLYTEDTYEIEGEPFFGHMRGRYSRGKYGYTFEEFMNLELVNITKEKQSHKMTGVQPLQPPLFKNSISWKGIRNVTLQ